MKLLVQLLVASLLVTSLLVGLARTSSAQTTAPAEAEALLAGVGDAYAHLRSLRLEAITTADYAAAGQTIRRELKSTAARDGGRHFRYELPGELVVAADAGSVYVYVPPAMRYYETDRDADGPLTPQTLGEAATAALSDADLSLLLSVVRDPAAVLRSLGEVSADGADALRVVRPDKSVWTLAFDPRTRLLREVTADESATLRDAGVPGVERALRRTTYTTVEPDADVAAGAVAFSPPAAAQQVEPGAAVAGDLDGKPAPALALPDLEGNVVSLASLKGKVVLVDFWASWCGPCVASIPHVKSLAEKHAGDGLAVLAVNLKEAPETARQFAADRAMNGKGMRVLLDADGAAGDRWGVAAIPYSVVVGRDGAVRKVIVGLDPEAVEAAVTAALAE